MGYRARSGILAIFLIIFSFVASFATAIVIFWMIYHGITCGNKGVDMYIYCIGGMLIFYTLMGTFRFLFTRDSGVDVPYFIYTWLIYLVTTGIGILLVCLGVPIPEKEKTFYVMSGASLVLGIAGYIVTCLVQNKQNDKRYDKLKKEIEERNL